MNHLPSTLSTQSSANTKEPYNTHLKRAHNYTIDLTENNTSKVSG